MANSYFRFKQFIIQQDACAMKVTTDACLFGAWCAQELAGAGVERLLDVGTGTGLLSLMISQKAALQIDGVEIDSAAATQAQQNIETSPWKHTIAVHNGDVLDMGVLKSYDCIVCNPPFYEGDLLSPDEKRNAAHHSRWLTFQALIPVMAKMLNAPGLFFLLLPFKRRQVITSLLNSNGLFVHNELLVKQTPTHLPFRIMLKGGFEKKSLQSDAISIANGLQQYTPEFVELLKDYYLFL